ncbi:hypothetical protein [Neobacillus sp. CF12]|uniref:hypothetical protein n=1 Tax=Neobacillus sp. CF12 TaxID=3055864 RepID=UPI00259FFDF5|nr:hypothetical protein [Neobacillus sp. CF12]MDM5326999.1 hypothetical protein [Neobacillus sp. CF12]
MAGIIRGMPDEGRINRNIEILKSKEWFLKMYQNNEEFSLKDETVRYKIGWTNVKKALKTYKGTYKLKKKIHEAINITKSLWEVAFEN